jgi:hypothetical protein
LIATSLGYDLEKAGSEREELRKRWVSDRPCIQNVPGPGTLDVTRLDAGDVYVSDEQLQRLEPLQGILGKPVGSQNWRRSELDRHHVGAAVLAEADGFVTTDYHDILRHKDEILEATGIRAVNPTEAVAWVETQG